MPALRAEGCFVHEPGLFLRGAAVLLLLLLLFDFSSGSLSLMQPNGLGRTCRLAYGEEGSFLAASAKQPARALGILASTM